MTLFITMITILINCLAVENQIYVHHTEDAHSIEYYDCATVESLLYCRRPKTTINLSRDNDTELCEQNGGQLHLFSALRSNQTNISDVLHQWRSSVERVEQYSLFSQDPSGADGSLCQCLHSASFGKNCEYQLPVGETLEETLKWQLIKRKENPQEMHVHGDVVCYEMLGCDSGALCLDWRETCDGIQNCLEGKDEENCDLLEMNICDDHEYRCMNGMCIPEEFFLDGELDCLDWSDEMPFKRNEDCFGESVSSECDDHLCPPTHWSCGDGQCIPSRLGFQKSTFDPTCHSGRDQYFICETRLVTRQWTMTNGRCHLNGEYREISAHNRSVEQQYKYQLQCALSQNAKVDCSCNRSFECAKKPENVLECSLILYPCKAVIAPYIYFLYNQTRDGQSNQPDFLLINGTVRCQHSLITMSKIIPFDINLGRRQTLEDYICHPSRSNISSSDIVEIRQQCHRANESLDVCNEWNPCLSITRLNDGWGNCLNRTDELDQQETAIEKSCTSVRRHRFRCATEQPTCLNILTLGSGKEECRNGFDELWLGTGRKLTLLNCNDRRIDECSLLRQYFDQSWRSANKSTANDALRIPFRFYCDTFEHLATRDDENLSECREWWICPEDQRRCGTGQCVEQRWFNDGEWDCPDASDEYEWMRHATEVTLRRASVHNFTDRSYFIPSTCNQSHPFFCLSSQSTHQGFSCLNLSQIGDGHIDCAGAIDERNTLRHCSESSILGNHFLCPSTNSCIPYRLHCNEGFRCPNRSDDDHWCSRQPQSLISCCSNDFVCFDGRCFTGGRCNRGGDCLFAEDEYMCDYASSFTETPVPFRQEKRFTQGRKEATFRLSQYPSNVTQISSQPNTTAPPSGNVSSNLSSASLSPYWCNRGIGVLSTKNHSIVCLCPPQYSGEKCQFHTDRLSVLVVLNLSQTIYILEGKHLKIVFKLLVLFLFNDEVLLRNQFQFLPSSQINRTLYQEHDDLISHFLYPQSLSAFRRERFFNRSSLLLHYRPFSIRFELYRMEHSDQQPSLIGVWKYPIHFDHLPVVRLAKVLHLTDSSSDRNPCSSRPCHPNEQCQQLMNNKSQYICLCKSNFSGENCSVTDPQCLEGYCSQGSLCQPNSGSSPFCLCPRNRFGRRCSIEHDRCRSNPCQNNGTCFPGSKPDQVICLCPRGYVGFLCQKRRVSIDLSLSTVLPHRAVVIQFFEIDLLSLDLILLHQDVSRTVPHRIEYLNYDDLPATGLVFGKLYSSSDADLHLLSVYLNAISLRGTTEISSINRCEHLRTFSHVHLSPIRYHQICIDNRTRLCFRDDVYLCICAENHTRVECFLYDDDLDRCEHCLAGGRCLQRDRRRPTDFLCLCPLCYSGRQCQFSSKSFTITLDQLFFTDLLSERKRTTITLMIFFSLLAFFLALPTNLFSFLTLRRRQCRRNGVAHYLLCLSLINQISLALLAARLVHLTVSLALFPSHPIVDDLFCKLLNYSLTCLTRIAYWLVSFVSIERAYTTVFLNKHWLKQPHIARRLMALTFAVVCLCAGYELVFIKSFPGIGDRSGTMCIIEFPSASHSRWIYTHQIITSVNFLLPLLINICCTFTIIGTVIRIKMNVRGGSKANGNERPRRGNLVRGVLNKNKEIIARPIITVVPSIFFLFSLPFLIVAFSFGCQSVENSWIRYLLIIFYFITFIPQMATFFLYIYPSTFYWKEWQATIVSQRITAFKRRRSPKNSTALSTVHEQKIGDG